MKLLKASIEKIAVENPTPLRIFGLPMASQSLNPHEFGHEYSKRTLLWLKNLPPLMATELVGNHRPYLPSNTGGKKKGQRYSFGIARNATEASRTFSGIAQAMADQWG